MDQLRLLTSIAGPGCPFWTGPPPRERIAWIPHNTATGHNGRVYGMVNESLRRLRTLSDYTDFNRSIGLRQESVAERQARMFNDPRDYVPFTSQRVK